MDHRLVPLRGHRPQPRESAAGEPEGRSAAGQVDDFHVAPEDTMAHARSKRFGAGLLGGETAGVRRRAGGPAVAFGPLSGSEDPVGETVAEPFQRALDAADIAEIRPNSDDHEPACARPSSMAMRMAFTVSSRPRKIASPMRKCPILSSTI